ATSPAPRYRPVMAWPAIAIASRANASSVHSRNAIWWAAIASSPIRAAIAVVTTSTACSESVRTTSAAPATAAARTPAQAEHQDRVEHDVHQVGADGDRERRAGVLQSAQHPRPGQHAEHGGRAQQADPQVGDGARGDARRRAEEVDNRRGERPAGREYHHADRAGQP